MIFGAARLQQQAHVPEKGREKGEAAGHQNLGFRRFSRMLASLGIVGSSDEAQNDDAVDR